ncbi:nitronate monooxygenase [Brachybacterium hainanense]|uniref:Propionate 3-nitronate monooxygenase n=1 Tax=Brachybacterium hainanense TaxID=1541174 RepID=A0ABV6RCW9_9MICO
MTPSASPNADGARTRRTRSALVDALVVPVLGAPMAGGPSTPELAAAVTGAGGLGSLAGGYRTARQVLAQIREARLLTDGPLGLNLFMPEEVRPDPADLARYAAALAPWAAEAGRATPVPPDIDPVQEDRELEETLEAVLAVPGRGIDLISTTFGPPSPERADRIHAAGIELGITVTTPEEVRCVLPLAPEILVVQGPEAGGHRSTFRQDEEPSGRPLPVLLAEVLGVLSAAQGEGGERRPAVVAAGGISSREDVRALLAAGADAVQVGTLLLPAVEAGTRPVHARALGGDSPTVVTRVFTGRPARALVTRTTRELAAQQVVGYPHVHRMTAPLRAAAGDDAGRLHLWAGTGHAGARPGTAAQILRALDPAATGDPRTGPVREGS